MNQNESLRIITEMITATKKSLSDNGTYYLIWGWAVLAAALINYFLLLTKASQPFLAWPVLMIAAGIITAIYSFKEKRKELAKSHLETTIQYLWIAFGASMLVVLGMMWKTGPEIAYPTIMLLYGIGSFVSGGMVKFRPLIIGGIICWLCAIGAYFLPFQQQLLVLIVAIATGFIIPGHILRAQHHERA